MADARPRVALRMLAGMLVWAAHFGVVYGFTALACARGFAATHWLGIGVIGWTIGAATTIALAATVAILVSAMRKPRRTGFADAMTAGVASLAAIAIVWETVPAFLVTPCA